MIAEIFFDRNTGIHRVYFKYVPSIPKAFRPVDNTPFNGLTRGTSIGNYHGSYIEKRGSRECLIVSDEDIPSLMNRFDRMDVSVNMYGRM